ncbi:MAG: energy-coupling factor transporter ATPase [Christensenellales bacterium]|jgi:energy-coupling factor transport system ATP-binding protein
MNIVEVKNVSYSYPGAQARAVNNVSFEVKKGEFVAIVGHNGSGKSTVARMLNMLIVPDEGEITIAGIRTGSEEAGWDVRKKCGMVFQNPDNQLVATVVEEDVAFGLENLALPPQEIRRRVADALAVVGMTDFADQQPYMLSGGQKQRIAIAGVIAMRPEIIVFDEATAMLDPSGQKSIMDIALKLNRDEGITVLWITHFMEEATRADRILAMDDGAIRLTGAPKDFFRQVDLIRDIGLDLPEMAKLALLLREKGIDLPDAILSVDEMAVAVCRLK